MASLTAVEAEQQHIRRMGEPLGRLYGALWQDMAWLHSKWQEYAELYGTKKSRIELLNRNAPRFFRMIEDVLWEDMLLHIARLMDRPSINRKSVLTFQALPQQISDRALKIRVKALIEHAQVKTLFCQDWRNNHIAHRNLEHALGRAARPLKPASRAQVRNALQALSAIMSAISEHYSDSETRFDLVISSGGAVELLYALDDASRFSAERQERLKLGQLQRSDIEARDL